MRIFEILSRNPAEITWKKDQSVWIGEFQTPSERWFNIAIVRLKDGSWSFEFSQISPLSLWLTGRGEKPVVNADMPVSTRRPTGRGEAFSVYGTVMAAMQEFLQTEQPEHLKFKGAIGKQTKLYRTMLVRYKAEIAALGYRASGASLIRKNPR